MVKGSEPPCFLFILGTISLVPFFHLLIFKYLKIEFISRLTGTGATTNTKNKHCLVVDLEKTPYSNGDSDSDSVCLTSKELKNGTRNVFIFFTEKLFSLSEDFVSIHII
jgi:hypothetical protein